ncbi:hypothetical protein [Amycolatopsis sp. cmx-4-83]
MIHFEDLTGGPGHLLLTDRTTSEVISPDAVSGYAAVPASTAVIHDHV